MKYLTFFAIIFLASCSTAKKPIKQNYPPSVISEVYVGCFNSVKYNHINKFNIEPQKEKIATYCDCSINKIQNKYKLEEFIDYMNKQDYTPLKKSTDECKVELKIDDTKPWIK